MMFDQCLFESMDENLWSGLVCMKKWGMKALIRYWGGEFSWPDLLQAGCLGRRHCNNGTKVKAWWSRRGLRGGTWVKFVKERVFVNTSSSCYPTVTDLWVRYWDFVFYFFKWRMRECCLQSQCMRCLWMEQVQNTVSVYQLEGLKDWSGPAWHWGSSGEKLFGGCSYKSFNRIRVLKRVERDLGWRNCMCKAVQIAQNAFLPLRMCGVPRGSRGTEGQELKLLSNDFKKCSSMR